MSVRAQVLKWVWKLIEPSVKQAVTALIMLVVKVMGDAIGRLRRRQAEMADKADSASAAETQNQDVDPLKEAYERGRREAFEEAREMFRKEAQSLEHDKQLIQSAASNTKSAIEGLGQRLPLPGPATQEGHDSKDDAHRPG